MGSFGLLSCALALAACSGSSGGAAGSTGAGTPNQPGPTPATSTGVTEAKSDKTRDTKPAVSDDDVKALTADGRAFATKIFAELRKEQKDSDNFFFSPHSIHTAFGMLYAGAQGSTEAAMKNALSYSLPQDRLHAAMNALDLALASRAANGGAGADGKGFRLAIANSLWSQQGFAFQAPYLDTLAVNYGAAVNLLDFQRDAEGATNTINTWIEQKTENRIRKMLSGLSPDTKLVLVNAVYFNAAWQTPFETSVTQPGTFHAAGGDRSTPMMSNLVWTRYQKTAAYDAIALPYEGSNVELVAIAPTAGTYSSFESGFDRAAFDAAIDGMTSSAEVQIRMPRFEIAGETISLKKALTTMGMGEAFADGANFQGVTPAEGFHVFDAAHKAFVKVDEKGTEAAAATTISAGGSAATEPVKITLDRPFLFAIRDVPTGAVLFLGRVVAPAE